MKLNLQSIQEAAQMMFLTDAHDMFGDRGVDCLKILLNSIREFFQHIPPDQMSTKFIFSYRMNGEPIGHIQSEMECIATSLSPDNLPGHRRHIEEASTILVDVSSIGLFNIIVLVEDPPLEELSQTSLVFVNKDGIDQFVIGGRTKEMPLLATGAPSNFAVPTVADLEEALELYRLEAANVSCPLLERIWVGGRSGHRLVLCNRPEATMRRSLQRFLSTRLRRDAAVRSEHNTDETKPVDLIVNWFGSKLRALIEIKWMGDSLTKESDGTEFTSYRDARAQEGADQLVDYLDREQSTDPTVTLRGYLVVFDGRRRHVVDPTTPLTSQDAHYYRNKNVVLTRDYAVERFDIAPLVRYFLEPRVSLLAPPS